MFGLLYAPKCYRCFKLFFCLTHLKFVTISAIDFTYFIFEGFLWKRTNFKEELWFSQQLKSVCFVLRVYTCAAHVRVFILCCVRSVLKRTNVVPYVVNQRHAMESTPWPRLARKSRKPLQLVKLRKRYTPCRAPLRRCNKARNVFLLVFNGRQQAFEMSEFCTQSPITMQKKSNYKRLRCSF